MELVLDVRVLVALVAGAAGVGLGCVIGWYARARRSAGEFALAVLVEQVVDERHTHLEHFLEDRLASLGQELSQERVAGPRELAKTTVFNPAQSRRQSNARTPEAKTVAMPLDQMPFNPFADEDHAAES